MHDHRAGFDVTGADSIAVRVLSIVQCYPLRGIIRNRITKKLSSKIDSEDVFQDILLIIVHRAKPEDVFRMHDAGELHGWLITLVRRTVCGIIRKMNTKKRSGGCHTYGESENQDRSRSPLLEAVYDEARSPSSTEAAIEVKHAMHAALSSLPLPYRRAVTLHYLECFPPNEVAEIMGKSLGAVRGLLYRGVRMLRARMGPAGQWFNEAKSEDYLWQVLGDSKDPTGNDGNT